MTQHPTKKTAESFSEILEQVLLILAAKVGVPFPLQIGTQQRAELDLNHF